MIGINVASNADRLLRGNALSGTQRRLAVMRALNRAADTTKTNAIREIQKRYNVTGKALRGTDRRSGAFFVKPPTPTRLVATVTASGNPLPLAGFRPRQTAKGVSLSVKKGAARRVIRGAFIARMKSGHVGVFHRMSPPGKRYLGKVGRHRGTPNRQDLPIDELYTTAVPGMFGEKEVQEALRKVAAARFETVLTQELTFRALRG